MKTSLHLLQAARGESCPQGSVVSSWLDVQDEITKHKVYIRGRGVHPVKESEDKIIKEPNK